MPENKIQITLEAIDKTKAAYDQASNSAKGLVENLKAHWIALSASVAGTVLAIERTISWAKAIANAANEIDRNSKSLNLSTDTYQRWTYAAKMADVSQEEFLIGLKLLSRNMDDASRGSGDAAKRFQAMGVSVKDASGNLRPLDDVMLDIMEKFSSWEDGPRKIAIALDLFGRSGERMVPLLNKGKSGFEELSKEARIVSKDTIEAGSKAEDAFKRMADNADKFKLSLSPLALLIADILEGMTKLIQLMKQSKESEEFVERAYFESMGMVPPPAAAKAVFGIEEGGGEIIKKKGKAPAMPDEEGLKLKQKALEENAKAWGDYAQEVLDSLEKMQGMKVDEVKASIAEDSKAKQGAIEEDARAWGMYADSVLDALEKMQLDKVDEIKKEIAVDFEAKQKAIEDNAKAWGDYADKVLEAREKLQLIIVEQQKQKWEEIAHTMQAIGASIGDIWTSNIQAMLKGTESLAEGIKKIFTDMADYAISMILKIAMNFALMGNAKGEWQAGKGLIGIIGSALGFAEGGISLGWKPIAAFQEGGIATRPTLGMIGEGGPEAFVPLKGGRIPVEMSGGGQDITNIYYIPITAMDTQSMRDAFMRSPGPIIEIISSDLGDKGATYQALTRRRQ